MLPVASVAINADRLIDIFFPQAFTDMIAVHRRIVIATLGQATLCQTSFDNFWSSTNLSIIGFDSAGHLRNARQRQGTVPLSGIQRADLCHQDVVANCRDPQGAFEIF